MAIEQAPKPGEGPVPTTTRRIGYREPATRTPGITSIPRPEEIGVIGPTEEEAKEFNEGKTSKFAEFTRTRLGKDTAAAIGTLVGFGVTHAIDPKIIPGIVEVAPNIPSAIANAVGQGIEGFKKYNARSEGDIFNSKAMDGEISHENAISVPTAEAVRKAQEITTPDTGFFILLPEPGNEAIIYDNNKKMLLLDNLPIGSKLVFPYKGTLSFTKSTSGDIGVLIEEIEINGKKAGDKSFMIISGHSFSLSIPDEEFTIEKTPGRSDQVRSSGVKVLPGQEIIQIDSNKTNPNHPYGPHQLYIGGSFKREGATGNADIKVKILPGDNDKAIVVQ